MADRTRRAFIGTAAAGVASSLLARSAPALRAQAGDSHLEILVNEPIGTIAPEIYGHFVEHLGGVVYDGIWVGEESKIPNVGGIRKALVDALKTIKPPVIRWPGGCFADSYDWRDGIGAADNRPRRTDFWADTRPAQNRAATAGPQRFDPNRLGLPAFYFESVWRRRCCRRSIARAPKPMIISNAPQSAVMTSASIAISPREPHRSRTTRRISRS